MTAPGDFSSGDVLTAADMNGLPGGVVASQTITTIFSTSSPHTTFQDTGSTVTFDEVSGRQYLHVAQFNAYAPGGSQSVGYQLLRGGVVMRNYNLGAPLSSSNSLAWTAMFYYTSAASGSVTWKWQIRGNTNNTQVTDFGNATFVRQYTVMDIG